jgi:hypothetical protein
MQKELLSSVNDYNSILRKLIYRPSIDILPVLAAMESQNIKANLETYEFIIKHFCSLNDSDKIKLYFLEMLSIYPNPSAAIISIVIQTLVVNRNLSLADELVNHILQLGSGIPRSSLSSLLNVFINNGNTSLVLKYYHIMSYRGFSLRTKVLERVSRCHSLMFLSPNNVQFVGTKTLTLQVSERCYIYDYTSFASI